MFPTLLDLGYLRLHSYGLMIALGFLAALYGAQRYLKPRGVDPQALSEMGFIALFLGVAGTRALYILMNPMEFSLLRPLEWFAVWEGGLVFQGAIPVTFLYVYIACRRRGIPFWQLVDAGIPGLALAHAFGRVGCFLNGCCYGQCSETLPWAVRFPPGSPVFYSQAGMMPMPDGWSHPVHPTQLYSVAALMAIFLLLLVLRTKWHPFTGFTMPVYLVLYGVKRFIVEMFRGDNNPTLLGFGLLSNQQVFSIISILLGIWLFLFLRWRAKQPTAAPAPPSTPEPRKKKR